MSITKQLTAVYEGPNSGDVSGETAGWTFTGTGASLYDAGTGAHGTTEGFVFLVEGSGTNLPGVKTNQFTVNTGDVLELSGWVKRAGGTASVGELRLLTYNSAGAGEAVAITITPVTTTADAWVAAVAVSYTVPSAVSFVAIAVRINKSPALVSDEYQFDDILLTRREFGLLRVIGTGTITVAGPAFTIATTTVTVPTGLAYIPQVMGMVTLDDPPDFVAGYELPHTEWDQVVHVGRAVAATDELSQYMGGYVTESHELHKQSAIRFLAVGASGLALNTTYYVTGTAYTTPSWFKVATTRANANTGTAVDITTDVAASGMQWIEIEPSDIRMQFHAALRVAEGAVPGDIDITASVEAADDQSAITFTFRYTLLAEEAFT